MAVLSRALRYEFWMRSSVSSLKSTLSGRPCRVSYANSIQLLFILDDRWIGLMPPNMARRRHSALASTIAKALSICVLPTSVSLQPQEQIAQGLQAALAKLNSPAAPRRKAMTRLVDIERFSPTSRFPSKVIDYAGRIPTFTVATMLA